MLKWLCCALWKTDGLQARPVTSHVTAAHRIALILVIATSSKLYAVDFKFGTPVYVGLFPCLHLCCVDVLHTYRAKF
jgi:hypothetical protein